jgi:hypothetical protein
LPEEKFAEVEEAVRKWLGFSADVPDL